MSHPTLSVIVPVYNERATVEEVIQRVRQTPYSRQIVAVDDGSTDGTSQLLAALAREGDLEVLRHDRNRGKGAALRTGFSRAEGKIVLIQDADLEYDPADYPALVEPILVGAADVVYGSRFCSPRPRRVLYYRHWLANQLLTALSNLTTDLNLTDIETGFKAFRREVVAGLSPTLKEDRFGIDPELTAKIARRGHRVYEVGIGYAGRTYGEGKKIGVRDAFRVLWAILRYARAD